METSELLERLLPMAERCLTLWELYINRKYPEMKPQQGEVWKKGDPIREPQTAEEYREFPSNQPGRFTRAIEQARASRDQG